MFYESYQYKFESYIYFYEAGINILRKNGVLAYITPELFLRLEKSENIRKLLHNNSDVVEIRLLGEEVFSDVRINSLILTLIKNSKFSDSFSVVTINQEKWEYQRSDWADTPLLKIDYEVHPKVRKVINKIDQKSRFLGEYGDAIQGLTPYDSYRGQSKELIKSRAFHHPEKIDDSCGMWLDGKNVGRYLLFDGDEWLQYGEWLASPREKRFFQGPRLLFREVPGSNRRIQATFTEETYYYGHSITPFLLSEEFNRDFIFSLLGLVNSKLLSWYAKFTLSNFSKKTFPKLNPKDIKSLPIPESLYNRGYVDLILMTQKNLSLNDELLRHLNKLVTFLKNKFKLEKLSRKLQSWHELEFGDFIKELNKAIKTNNKEREKEESELLPMLSKKDEFEWMELFEENKKKALELQREIEKTDREIDRMVYELYGLTEGEIAIVESSTE